VLILGSAGTGKTYLINKIIEKLKDKKILRLAPTNKSALLIGAETLDKFTHSFVNGNTKKYKNIDYVFIDEISMVRELFYQVLITLKYNNPNIKFIISGDFYQLPPVNDRVNKSYQNSRVLYELVDGQKLELTKCKRSNDELFNICENVKVGNYVNIKTGNKKSYLNICFSNKKRIQINTECINKYIKENPGEFINIEKLSYDENSQDYKLMVGMPLIARINKKSINIVNNEVFEVSKINNNSIIVKNEMKEIEINICDINRTFNIAYCTTIHKSQGQTFDQQYTIYEWKKLDNTLKYVALSRSSNINYINII
jgi:ATP-dependent exoDNAse (exonuclease V) alpha subunit